MYTVVLMAALTGGSASTGFWPGHGCNGCHGCHGWGYSTYSGNLCHGCYGASPWNGCQGNYYGVHSTFSVYAPVACVGCFGCTGCYGCYGGWSCYGVALPHHGYWNECPPGVVVPERKKDELNIEETPLPKEQKAKPKSEKQARVSFEVPATARVYIDGQLMKSGAGKRVFQTPELAPGEVYFYDVRVEVVRDGQTLSHTQRIILHPGTEVTASFPNLDAQATAAAQTNR